MSIKFAEIKKPEQTAAAPAPAMPDERRGHWDKVFLDPEYFDSIAKQPGIVEGAKVSMFGDDYAYRAAMIGYLSDTRQVPLDDMKAIYDAEKDSVAQKEFGKQTISSRELFDFTKKKFETDKAKEDAGRAITENVIKRGLMDALGGGNNDHYKDTAADIEAQAELFNDEERFQLQQRADEIDMQLRSVTAKHGADAKWIFTALARQTGTDQTGYDAPAAEDMAAKFADLPDNQRKAVLTLAGSFAKLQKVDKGFFYQMAESLGRGVGDFAERIPRNWSEAQVRGDLRILTSGKPVYKAVGLDGSETFSQAGETPMSAEEIDAARAKLEKRTRVFKLQRELRELAESDIDPIKVMSSGGLTQIVEEGLYGAARSIPYTAVAAVPYLGGPGVFAAIYSQNYDGIMIEHPEIDPDKAALVALASAPIEAALERLKVNTIMGRLPIFGRLVKTFTHPNQRFLTRFMLNATGVIAEQNLQEVVQNSTFPVAQMIAAAIDEDMPGYDLRKGLENAPRNLAVQFVALLPLTLMGMGGVYAREIKRGDEYLTNAEAMAKLGVDQAGIDRVMAEPTTEARQAVWKEVYTAVPIEQREAAAAQVVEDILDQQEFLRMQEAPETLPRMEKQGGDYTIVSPTGEVIHRTTNQDSAELMLKVARREAMQQEMSEMTQGITEAVSYLTAVQTARQQGEDVQKVVLTGERKNLFDEYQGDPTKERFAAIRAAVLASTGEDVTEPEQLRAYWVDASNSGAMADGIYRSVINIFDGADGTKVVRDFAQDNLKRAIAEGRVGMDWVREQLNATIPLVQGSNADVQLKTETDADVIESFSDIALAFLYGRVKRDQIAPGLRGFLVRMARVVRDIFRRAYNLEKARVAGQLSPEWQGLLAESVGIDSQGIVDNARKQAADGRGEDGLTDDERAALVAEMQADAEAEAQQNAADGGIDIIAAIIQAGGLPSATSRAVQQYAGELKVLRENAKGGRDIGVKGTSLSRLFKKNAPDLDNLIRDLRGMGFLQIETPSDVFELVEQRIITGKPIYGYEARATAGVLVGNYSVSEAKNNALAAMSTEQEFPILLLQEAAAPFGRLVKMLGGTMQIDSPGSFYVRIRIPEDADTLDFAKEIEEVGISVRDHAVALSTLEHGRLTKVIRVEDMTDMDQVRRAGEKLVSALSDALAPYDDWLQKSAPAIADGGAGIKTGNQAQADKSKMPDLQAGQGSALTTSPDTTFSISSQAQIERVNAALSGMNRGPEMRAKVYERARDKFQRMLQENQGFLYGLKQGGAKAADVRRTKLLQAMGELDAILSVLPPEVRGKVGGLTTLANIGTGDKALADFFIKRIEMIDKELERMLRNEWGEAATKLFTRARPQRNQPGQKPKGKFGYEVHDLFKTLEDATEWTEEKALGYVSGLWQEINGGELTPEAEAHKSLEAELVPLFANWAKADSTRMANAVTIGNDVLTRAYRAERDRVMRVRTLREMGRFDLVQAAQTSGDLVERQAQAMRDNSLPGTWRAWMFNLFNFDQVVSYVFGENSPVVRELVERQRVADNTKTDGVIGKSNKWADFIATLAGGNSLAGQRLVFEMSQKSAEFKIGDSPYKFSQNELIAITMMWMQPRGREHMLGKVDDSGEPIGKWHYNQDFVTAAEQAMTDEARKIRDYLLAEYDAEYNAINEVYRRVFGINLPKEKNYSPLVVNTLISGGQAGLDPVTGATFAAGSRSPGALKSRGGNVAEPTFRDAVQTYMSHMMQMEHWKAFAEFNADMASILNHRDVRNAIDAKAGTEANKTLGTWLQYFNEGGSRDAASHLAITGGLNQMLGRFATMALFGRVSTLALQSTQLAAASAKMPVGAYLSRLGKLLSGQLSWGAALSSPYIQRRIQQMPPQVQVAMQGLNASEPTKIKDAARRLGSLLSGADGLFTAGTYAMVYDYQLSQGASPEQAAKEAERITDEIAQPTRAGARSIYELTATDPLKRAMWAFGSEARKNLGLAAFTSAKRTPRARNKAIIYVLLLNGLISTIIRSAFRDLKDDDDEELFDSKNWSLKALPARMLADSLYGIPVLGEVAGRAVGQAMGVWQPTSGVFDMGRSVAAVRRSPETIADLFAGEADWGDVARDVNAILTAMGLFNDQLAGAASISNLVKDLFQTADAQLGPEE
jgi:hypothetical protein